MNVDELRVARKNGLRPAAPDADLREANLWGANLWGADLREADLRGANLRGADLREANLWGANLRGANLWGANLQRANLLGANLWGANLRGADLREANLWGANLQRANLSGANLWGANLRGAGIIGLGETPSGGALIFPTPDGWVMQVGCWRGSPDDLRALIAKDAGWPDARGTEVARRRPYLEAILAHVDLIVAEKADLIPALAEKWGAK